jgi:hypothetical protein
MNGPSTQWAGVVQVAAGLAVIATGATLLAVAAGFGWPGVAVVWGVWCVMVGAGIAIQ